jgi:hypothetical protein
VVWDVGGGLLDMLLERGDSELFKMLSPRFLVGHLVKRRRHGVWLLQQKGWYTLVEMVGGW